MKFSYEKLWHLLLDKHMTLEKLPPNVVSVLTL